MCRAGFFVLGVCAMGKRSDFERVPRDFYPTPYEALIPLLPHLSQRTWYNEPCAGDGALVWHLDRNGHRCCDAADIEPRWNLMPDKCYAFQADALSSQYDPRATHFITNPPWDRKILHPLIAHLSDTLPTWLLFDADWMHTRQSAPYMCRLRKVVSVGRVKWIPGSKMTGKDNCCWYLFDKPSNETTEFFGRG